MLHIFQIRYMHHKYILYVYYTHSHCTSNIVLYHDKHHRNVYLGSLSLVCTFHRYCLSLYVL